MNNLVLQNKGLTNLSENELYNTNGGELTLAAAIVIGILVVAVILVATAIVGYNNGYNSVR